MTKFGMKESRPFVSCIILLLAILAAVPSVPANAQDVQKIKDWQIRCIPKTQKQNPQSSPCVAEHVHVNPETKRAELLIQAQFGGPQKILAAAITVPLLVRLPPGVKLRIDNRDVLTVPYQICAPTGCVAQFLLESDLLSAFQKGSKGVVVVELLTGKERVTPFSLLGFTKALDGLK